MELGHDFFGLMKTARYFIGHALLHQPAVLPPPALHSSLEHCPCPFFVPVMHQRFDDGLVSTARTDEQVPPRELGPLPLLERPVSRAGRRVKYVDFADLRL
jgi:hypothetical protein